MGLTTKDTNDTKKRRSKESPIWGRARCGAKEDSGSAAATASGTLKAVDVVLGSITISVQGSADLTLKTNASTQVSGTASSTATLATKIGSKVTASYDAQTKVATSVRTEA